MSTERISPGLSGAYSLLDNVELSALLDIRDGSMFLLQAASVNTTVRHASFFSKQVLINGGVNYAFVS